MSKVDFESANKQGSGIGYVFKSSKSQSSVGIIYIQEWWGVNEQIKQGAALFSEKSGFVTLIPDLYRGKVAEDSEEAGHLMNNLDWQGAVQDISGAVKYLKEKEGCKKVGVVGFCMGT
jgi:carboxymethylenebutenolidase